MAYLPAELRLLVPTMGNSGAPNIWAMDGTDAFSSVGSTTDYISDALTRGVRKGDIVLYRRWDVIATKATVLGTKQYQVTGTVSATGASLSDAASPGDPTTFTVAIAASATTDGMDITVTATNDDGTTVAAPVGFEWWISEAATGIGLTADSYSGTVTASTGAIHTALTAKKHFLAVTAATGIFVATAVDNGNPVDQYVVVKRPNGLLVVSAISDDNWEGA
jgi:hypothetical protein